ncbi:adenylosuccinate lyase [Buchnera aphidicola]|uniref:Adenylosuccinate lyase n=1 Tax=Buchnera aphidicola (Sarucallis kahawaluokalani) TaxID=1241878 RepID=A0A4D6Y8J0_9GAMM|nr:adenylosuccinate lyase [Buchnera aphidicola]QCI25977.1 adenylosuccinate lyase [Buchnera aphidicola (Sarucallis kahawaluokalani)]
MNDGFLLSISPIDGRYHKNTKILKKIFSEYSFLRLRLKIEIKWLQQLSQIEDIHEIPKFDNIINNFLDNLIKNFNYKDALEIKKIEQVTKHDVKAIEYFLRNKIASNISNYKNIIHFIHFSCTSDDINNLAYACMMKKTVFTILVPLWKKILSSIKFFSHDAKRVSILSRTHGQPATPTTLGKIMTNFYYRMKRQLIQLKNIVILGKFNGATGNYNAHIAAYPNVNWHQISQNFVISLGLQWNPYTTQIEPHDYISEIFSCIVRFNTILINFNQDIWGYITLDYFKQKIKNDAIGSSTMPHKVNPIEFEKSEGNLGLANAVMNHMIIKLPISRWQRDLSDSTILRNIGVVIGYSIIAYDATLLGLNKIEINYYNISKDLHNRWQLLAEPIHTVMRRFGIVDSYEQLKQLTRNKNITKNDIHAYIDKLHIPKVEKQKLKKINPNNYIGNSIQLVEKI